MGARGTRVIFGWGCAAGNLCGFIFRAVIKRQGPGISPGYYEHVPQLLSSGNRKEIEPKGIPVCFIPSLLVVLFTWQLEILVTSQILLPYTWLSSQNPSLPVFLIYNHQQNKLRHFPLKELFDIFLTSKGEKNSFSSPIPSMQCCAAVRAAFRKQQTLQLWMEGAGEECGFFCSLKLPYLRTMSQQFWQWL